MSRLCSNDYYFLVTQYHMYDQGAVIVDYQLRWHVVGRPNIHVVIVQWVIIWMMSMVDGKMGDEMLQNFRRHCQLDEEW
jgi:hypothetical protein